ncbi:26S protease regulatory subunit 4 [Venturia nashicola]|uniref:26S protease regulatory subunit 4 n=1 Tax=Venturia nashicola TaxID=86259 RepID=A0A4Z1NXY5_9PEZI|nr:26S protease regulatory subunit 4 [Venturia nashicola]
MSLGDEKDGSALHTKDGSKTSRGSSETEDIEKDNARAQMGQAPLAGMDMDPSGGVKELKNLRKLDSNVIEVKEENNDPFRHLPNHEQEVLRRQVFVPNVKVGYFSLYRYASRWDWTLWWVSVVCTIIAGAAMPLMTIVFGGLTGLFADYFQGKITYGQFNSKLSGYVLYFLYLAIGSFITTYISTVGFIYVGERCTGKIRERYLKAMLRQNIAFFDKLGAGEVTTRITADTNFIEDGISEKFGLTLNSLSTFITAFVIAFIKYWKLTLILTSTVFAIVIVMGSGSHFIVKWTALSQVEYAQGGTVAEEVLSSVRNAIAFNTQDKLAKVYDSHLEKAESNGRKLQISLGAMIAMMMTLVYLNYSLSFWQASRFLVQGDLSVSSALTVLFSVMIGAFSLGNIAPNFRAFTSAVAAGQKIFAAIDRTSPLDPDSPDGKVLDNMKGTIELRNIKHIYPSRPEVVVMNGVDLMIPAGKQTALVGTSGSGKSTIVGLVERFYEPVGGDILLDGHNIREINLRWLRQNISLVQQEPVLFATTIYENIRYGLLGTEFEKVEPEKQRDLIEGAAKMSNAHDFIMALSQGYQTHVGERGFLLSGGQKQRIAIARAVVSDPKILLLDEATSALDTKSEGVVQAALDKAAQGRTTIVIAHRLSTIKNADNIVVMSRGVIIEQGRHSDLLERKGAYFNLVEAQRIAAEIKNGNSEEVEILQEIDDQNLHREATNGKGEPIDPDDEDPAGRLKRMQSGKSISSIELAKRGAEKKPEYSLWRLMGVVWSFNKADWPIMLIGFVCSIIAGGGNPVQAVFFAKAIAALSLPPSQFAELRSEVNFWSLMYLMLAGTQFISNLGHGAAFGYCSERLVHRARDGAFRHMLRQDIEYFDRDENNAGALTTFLSTSATHLSGLSGQTLGTLLQVSTTLVAACAISLVIGWKLALVCISTIPILLGCGYCRYHMLASFQARSKAAYASSAGFACEATSAIRTVASLTREEDVFEKYHAQLEDQAKKSLVAVAKSSTLYAASQSVMFFCIALGFWYGGTLIAKREFSQFQFFVCFSSIIFGAQSAGTIFSFAPDMGKAKNAAAELQTLFDRKPKIDCWSEEGDTLTAVEGHVEFRDVHFRYPTRPEQPVLRGLNLSIKPGQYVALVGASGCGKSTTIALLERFYDPLSGGVYVDGHEVSKLNVNDYRSYLALVSQEPTLYQGTIRENVLLGADREGVPEEEIITACKNANIYDFIMSLPDGFNTVCGQKGGLLSGGQKQRIAIARALLRNPKILLLDEATSALDSESEKIVQLALDKAAKGRTTIAVAHRLSTIQKADIIYVIDGGRVVEEGSHNYLLSKNGRYAELVTMQSLEKAA